MKSIDGNISAEGNTESSKIAEAVEKLSKGNGNALSIMFFIKRQKEGGYTLSSTQLDDLITAMAKETENFGPLMYVIQGQKEKGYTLSTSNVDKLIMAMSNATKNFDSLVYLLQEEDEKGYKLTEKQRVLLEDTLKRNNISWTRESIYNVCGL